VDHPVNLAHSAAKMQFTVRPPRNASATTDSTKTTTLVSTACLAIRPARLAVELDQVTALLASQTRSQVQVLLLMFALAKMDLL